MKDFGEGNVDFAPISLPEFLIAVGDFNKTQCFSPSFVTFPLQICFLCHFPRPGRGVSAPRRAASLRRCRRCRPVSVSMQNKGRGFIHIHFLRCGAGWSVMLELRKARYILILQSEGFNWHSHSARSLNSGLATLQATSCKINTGAAWRTAGNNINVITIHERITTVCFNLSLFQI